jgi:hypothetical protein
MSACGDPGESNLDQCKQTDALSDLVAERSKHSFLICVVYSRQGVMELPMHNLCFLKLRTFGSRTIAQRNHEVETTARNILCCFRSSAFQINVNFSHHFDCKRVNVSSFDASANYLKMR